MHSELLRVRHTPFFLLHGLFPVLGMILFCSYFGMYHTVEVKQRMQMIFEITITVFSVIISCMIGIAVMQEEQNHFFLMLSNTKRIYGILQKLLFLWGMGVMAVLFLLTSTGVGIWVFTEISVKKWILEMLAGLIVWSAILYVWHLFLNLKFGMGISVFLGVFESLQVIIYSNVELKGIFVYIPFAWQMNWMKDILNGSARDHLVQWLICTCITAVAIILLCFWFSYWEGRKNYEI